MHIQLLKSGMMLAFQLARTFSSRATIIAAFLASQIQRPFIFCIKVPVSALVCGGHSLLPSLVSLFEARFIYFQSLTASFAKDKGVWGIPNSHRKLLKSFVFSKSIQGLLLPASTGGAPFGGA
jgi:hypothetical protein